MSILDISNELKVILTGAVPLLELRGAIPFGVVLGFTPLKSTLLSIIGNILPVPFLLLLLKPVMEYLDGTKYAGWFIEWLRNRTIRKSDKIRKYSVLGLFLLVAIPLPTTGAYTGCVAASLFNIRFKHSFPAVIAGVLAAGLIVFTLTTVGVDILHMK